MTEAKLVISKQQARIFRPIAIVGMALISTLTGGFIGILAIMLGLALLPIPYIGLIVGTALIFFGVVGIIVSPFVGVKIALESPNK